MDSEARNLAYRCLANIIHSQDGAGLPEDILVNEYMCWHTILDFSGDYYDLVKGLLQDLVQQNVLDKIKSDSSDNVTFVKQPRYLIHPQCDPEKWQMVGLCDHPCQTHVEKAAVEAAKLGHVGDTPAANADVKMANDDTVNILGVGEDTEMVDDITGLSKKESSSLSHTEQVEHQPDVGSASSLQETALQKAPMKRRRPRSTKQSPSASSSVVRSDPTRLDFQSSQSVDFAAPMVSQKEQSANLPSGPSGPSEQTLLLSEKAKLGQKISEVGWIVPLMKTLKDRFPDDHFEVVLVNDNLRVKCQTCDTDLALAPRIWNFEIHTRSLKHKTHTELKKTDKYGEEREEKQKGKEKATGQEATDAQLSSQIAMGTNPDSTRGPSASASQQASGPLVSPDSVSTSRLNRPDIVPRPFYPKRQQLIPASNTTSNSTIATPNSTNSHFEGFLNPVANTNYVSINPFTSGSTPTNSQPQQSGVIRQSTPASAAARVFSFQGSKVLTSQNETVSQLNKSLKETQEEISKLSQRTSALENGSSEINRLTKSLKQKQEKVADMVERINELEEVEEAQATKATSLEQREQIQKDIINRIRVLEGDKKAHEDLALKMEALELRSKGQEELNLRLKDLEKKAEAREAIVAKIKSLELMEVSQNSLAKRVTSLEVEKDSVAKLAARIDNLQREKEMLTAQMQAFDKDKESQTADINALKQGKADQKALIDISKGLVQYMESYEKATKKLEELSTNVNTLEEKKTTQTGQIDFLLRVNRIHAEKLNSLEEAQSSHPKLNQALSSRIQTLEQRNASQAITLQSLVQEKPSQSQKKLLDRIKNLEQSQKSQEMLVERIHVLEREKEALEQEMVRLRGDLGKVEEEFGSNMVKINANFEAIGGQIMLGDEEQQQQGGIVASSEPAETLEEYYDDSDDIPLARKRRRGNASGQ